MLLRYSLFYLAGRGLPGVISFFAIAVYTRLLPPEQYGRYALVLAGVQLAQAVLFRWLGLGLMRFLPVHAGRPPGPLLATLLTGYGAMVALALVLGGLGALLVSDPAWRSLVLLAIPLLSAVAWFELNLTLAQTQLAPSRYGLMSLLKAALALAGGAGLIVLGLGAAGPLLALVLAALLPSLVMLDPWRRAGRPRPASGLMRELAVYGLPLTATFALNFVISGSDRFLIAYLIDTEAAGTYAAAYDLGWIGVSSLMVIVNLAGYPLLMRALERTGQAAAQAQLQQHGLLLLTVALPALVGIVTVAPNLARVMLGAPFRAAGVELLPWVALAALLAGCMLYYTNLAFQLGRRTTGQLWVTAAAALANLLLNLLWIPRFGLLGAAYATVVAYGIGFALGWQVGRRAFPLPGLPADVLKVVIACAVMTLALWPSRTWTGPLVLAGQIALGMLVYALALALLDRSFRRGRLVRLLRHGQAVPKS